MRIDTDAIGVANCLMMSHWRDVADTIDSWARIETDDRARNISAELTDDTKAFLRKLAGEDTP